MKLNPIETKYLRASVVLLMLGLLLGGGLAGYTYLLWQKAQQQNKIAVSENAATKDKLARAAQEELELKEKIGRYLDLQKRGYIGPEKRLDWIEQLARIRRERKLADMQYELSAQHPVDKNMLPSGAEAGNHAFLTSTLKIATSLLHEGDIVQLFDDIEKTMPALSSVRTCSLARQSGKDRSLKLRYSLQAQCTIELITLKDQTT